MDDNIIAIIITLAIAAYGAYINSKKKKESGGAVTPEMEEIPEFWSPAVAFPSFETVPEEGERIISGNKRVKDYAEFNQVVQDEIKPVFEEGKSDLFNREQNRETEARLLKDEKVKHSWKKAVIYNEILNRKYF